MGKKRIGIIGGTFDPIHYGHLLAADQACLTFGLSEVIFMPAGTPPHKAGIMTKSEDRWMMAVLATNDCPCFSVSRIEIDRPGNSYTTDTLRALREERSCADADFYFIVGLDALLLIESWKEPEELLNLCTLVAVSRPGYLFESLKKLPKKYRNVICTLEIPHLDISSTKIRELISKGESTRFLTPPAVVNYVEKHSLYKSLTAEE